MMRLSLGLAGRINLALQTAQAKAMMHLRDKKEVQLAANHQLATRAAKREQAYN